MSHLDQERTCSVCKSAFRLADHGVAGAKAIAQALDSGEMAEADAPAIARTCPNCQGTPRMQAEEAHAEIFRLDHAAKLARDRKIPRDTKVYASGLVFIGLSFIGGSLAFGAYRGHDVISWSGVAFGAMMAVGGVLVGVFAFRKVFGGRNRQL